MEKKRRVGDKSYVEFLKTNASLIEIPFDIPEWVNPMHTGLALFLLGIVRLRTVGLSRTLVRKPTAVRTIRPADTPCSGRDVPVSMTECLCIAALSGVLAATGNGFFLQNFTTTGALVLEMKRHSCPVCYIVISYSTIAHSTWDVTR